MPEVPSSFAKTPQHDTDDDDNTPLLLSKLKKPVKKGPVKQEPDSDLDDVPISLSSLKRKKEKTHDGGSSRAAKQGPIQKKNQMKVKKEQVEEEEFDVKPLMKKIKEEVVKIRKKGTIANGVGAEDGKKVRKVYSLPGQKHDPPEERDPLRIFYESLYQQVPTSEMAATWMMEWGLLPEKEAAIVYAKKLKAKQQNLKSPVKMVVSASKTVKVTAKKPKEEPVGTPVKSVKKPKEEPKESPTKPKSKPSKKRKAKDDSSDEEEDDDDFVMPQKKVRKMPLWC